MSGFLKPLLGHFSHVFTTWISLSPLHSSFCTICKISVSLVIIFLPTSHHSPHIWCNLIMCWILSLGKDFIFTKRLFLLQYMSTINSIYTALLWSSFILTAPHSVRIIEYIELKGTFKGYLVQLRQHGHGHLPLNQVSQSPIQLSLEHHILLSSGRTLTFPSLFYPITV